ncbi:hypothetical protein CP978_04980 [Streptomyces nodosus]|uniref:Uncharacterized protein n=1 Tax=Streptomyces nodosus TaxID=40318 RepID=A0A5P2VXT9_9ACTN|nr:hypothetical protein CP978_04980 [Streptomyces nodosus]
MTVRVHPAQGLFGRRPFPDVAAHLRRAAPVFQDGGRLRDFVHVAGLAAADLAALDDMECACPARAPRARTR